MREKLGCNDIKDDDIVDLITGAADRFRKDHSRARDKVMRSKDTTSKMKKSITSDENSRLINKEKGNTCSCLKSIDDLCQRTCCCNPHLANTFSKDFFKGFACGGIGVGIVAAVVGGTVLGLVLLN